jgi:hypothetical protein
MLKKYKFESTSTHLRNDTSTTLKQEISNDVLTKNTIKRWKLPSLPIFWVSVETCNEHDYVFCKATKFSR